MQLQSNAGIKSYESCIKVIKVQNDTLKSYIKRSDNYNNTTASYEKLSNVRKSNLSWENEVLKLRKTSKLNTSATTAKLCVKAELFYTSVITNFFGYEKACVALHATQPIDLVWNALTGR